ncbi:MAG: DNA double-strand break repair nuclease NurA, partial [Phycisphaerae bacterium]
MPYDGEYATYRPLRRISECQRVKGLLARTKLLEAARAPHAPHPIEAPLETPALPRFILAIDGSYAEVAVKNGYPGAKVGYCTAASVLLDLDLVGRLDVERPVNPVEFRKTEQAASVDAALPGSNVITRRQNSARASFREEFYDLFTDIVVDEDDRTNLLCTYETLLSLKPTANPQSCPYKESHACTAEFPVGPGCGTCPTCGRPVYSTDALRIHERFRDVGTNGEAFGLVMQIMERLLLVHFLRCFEKRGLLQRLTSLAFFIDGPLAVFGPPAWLSAAICKELKRLNREARESTGQDLIILGIEKGGAFVQHFEEIDQTETPGQHL